MQGDGAHPLQALRGQRLPLSLVKISVQHHPVTPAHENMSSRSGPDTSDLLLLSLLALQFGVQPFLSSRFLSRSGCDPRVVVLFTELAKASLCLLGRAAQPAEQASGRPGQILLTAAPAACYLIQNLALQQAYADLDSLTFNCLNQTKVAATALCLYLLQGSRQTRRQLVALGLLTAAGLLLQLQGEHAAAARDSAAVGAFRRGVAVSHRCSTATCSSTLTSCSGLPAGLPALRPGVRADSDCDAGVALLAARRQC